MARFNTEVFTNKLAALRYCRQHDGKFFEATVPNQDPETVYVVAISEHQAKLALVDYLMDLKQWSKRDRETQYLAALEAEVAQTASSGDSDAKGDD